MFQILVKLAEGGWHKGWEFKTRTEADAFVTEQAPYYRNCLAVKEVKTCCVCGKPMPKPNTIGAHNKPFQENICSWKCWKEAYGEYEN